ncbi:hypothetical protein C8J56DRAFT_829311 [Mycena floridula]|nr:hypothetical protein C8J56DRAFT_829311 [Mycena floridula]
MFLPIFQPPFADCMKCGQKIDVKGNSAEMDAAYAAYYRNVLISNHSFPDVEAVAHDEIQLLESRVVDVDKSISVLLQMRDEIIQHSIALRKAIVAPIRKLPNEILEKIFSQAHCTPAQWSSFDMSSIPWVVGQVCSRWRDIASSCPSLWSTFKWRLSDQRTWNKERSWVPGRIMQECLRRSSNSPLTLTLRPSGGSLRDVEPRHIRLQVLMAIFAHCERWKYLNIVGTLLDELPVDMITSVIGRLPQLEGLVWAWPTEAATPSNLFAVAPRLCDLEIHFPFNARLFDESSFPWPQLQTLRLHLPHWDKGLVILANCTNLVHCELYDHSPFPPAPAPVGSFSHLRILRCPASALDAFGHIPVLEELHLTDMTDFRAFLRIERSASQFTVLSILQISSDEQCNMAISLLKACTALTTLHLQYIQRALPFATIASLIHFLHREPPALQNLKVRMHREDFALWFFAIGQRCAPSLGTRCLKSIHVTYFDDRLLDEMQRYLKDTEERGFEKTSDWPLRFEPERR